MKIFAFFFVLACIASFASGGDIKMRQARDAFKYRTIGDKTFFYGTPISTQSHDDANEFCKDQFACLADLEGFTPAMFASLARFLPENTKFWIDGSATLSLTNFETTCNGVPAQVNFGTIEAAKIDLSSTSCLAFNRPSDSLQSTIVSLPCTIDTEAAALCYS